MEKYKTTFDHDILTIPEAFQVLPPAWQHFRHGDRVCDTLNRIFVVVGVGPYGNTNNITIWGHYENNDRIVCIYPPEEWKLTKIDE
ncbi:MAG: hypothetical protein V1851_01895 [Patescibacteria group bacterium]